MYTKQEESFLRKQFWTTFGQYISPVPSAEGLKINWINYKTGIRFIQLKMDVMSGMAYIGIEISHLDIVIRRIYYDHFKLLQNEFEELVSENWIWEKNIKINDKDISRIYFLLSEVSIYKKDDWPQIISFLKEKIVLFDVFWCKHQEIFKMLL